MIRYSGTIIGKVVIKQGDKKVNVQIRLANCIAALIIVTKATKEQCQWYGVKGEKYLHTIYDHFPDIESLKYRLKIYGKILHNEVVDISLNLYFKECRTMLLYFVKSGYKVNCFYKAYCYNKKIREAE